MAAQNLISIRDSQDLGKVMRATRKWQRLKQDEVGRFSHSFIGEVEAGKPTAQLGKVLEALRQLGIRCYLELPADMALPGTASSPAAMASPHGA
jgi:HTH-type transcriptional regulator/antitoxin HipB